MLASDATLAAPSFRYFPTYGVSDVQRMPNLVVPLNVTFSHVGFDLSEVGGSAQIIGFPPEDEDG
jgi:hypothetical protein